jgi:hypothetical protein
MSLLVKASISQVNKQMRTLNKRRTTRIVWRLKCCLNVDHYQIMKIILNNSDGHLIIRAR